MSKIYCGNCGAEVVLPKTSSHVNGMTISEQSKGDYTMQMKQNCSSYATNNTTKLNVNANTDKKESKVMAGKRTAVEERMAKLRENGIDTSKYVAFDNKVMEIANGQLVELAQFDFEKADDEVIRKIFENGYVKNIFLYRRWVLAQFYKMVSGEWKWWSKRPLCSFRVDEMRYNYNEALKAKGYVYQWNMLIKNDNEYDRNYRWYPNEDKRNKYKGELHLLAALERSNDKSALEQETHFFNKDVVVAMCNDYLAKLKFNLEHKNHYKKFDGKPYVEIGGEQILLHRLEKELYSKIRKGICEIKFTNSYTELQKKVMDFYKKFVNVYRLPSNAEFCKEWVEAYKGVGGFYSLWNLVTQHGCFIKPIHDDYWSGRETGEVLYGVKAARYLQSRLDKYNGEGYRWLAMALKCIADNNWRRDW